MATKHYSSVNEWLEAGRPLNEPFLIVRECTMSAEDIDNKDYALDILGSLCALIVRSLIRYRDELGGSGYHIEPALSMFHPRTLDYENETFGVFAELPIISDQARVRFSVGAIATILPSSAEKAQEEPTWESFSLSDYTDYPELDQTYGAAD